MSRRCWRCSPASAPRRSGWARTRCACTRATSATRSTSSSRATSAPPSCSPGPLLARHGRASVPPPGGDVIGRRRLDPHIHAFAELGATLEYRRPLRAGRHASGRAHPSRRAVGDGDRERGHGREPDARPDDDLERGERTARPGSLPLPPSLGAEIDGIGSNVLARSQASSGSARRHARDRPRARRGRQLHRHGGRHRRRHHDRRDRARRPLADPAGAPPARRRGRARRRLGARAARTAARDRRRPRWRDPEGRGRPVAAVPGRPDLDRGGRRDAGEGHGAHLREDVREPPVLRRQARVDGCADHPLRPAPRS